jgi:hypothetical protein
MDGYSLLDTRMCDGYVHYTLGATTTSLRYLLISVLLVILNPSYN